MSFRADDYLVLPSFYLVFSGFSVGVDQHRVRFSIGLLLGLLALPSFIT